jgi:hypothetical protein
VEGFARREGWRLLDVTMSTCSPADIPIWVPLEQRVESACSVWREPVGVSLESLPRCHRQRSRLPRHRSPHGYVRGNARGSAW